MFVADRQQSMVEYLKEHHSATVTELSRMYYVSETSIRRDLARLERAGLVRKTYGGALIADGGNEVIALEARQQIESEAKVIMARKAASLITNGQVIFLDSSSTVLSMIPFLTQFTNLSVITASLKAATMLAEYPHLKVYLLGGLLNTRTHSTRGMLACDMLRGLRADRVFLSPRGIDASGHIFCQDEEEASIRRMMMERAGEATLLCHTKKLGENGTFLMNDVSRVRQVVCEKEPDECWIKLFREAGAAVM